MSTTYPKAQRLSIGYDPREDRLILTGHLQSGEDRKAMITRRLLSRLLDKMSSELSSTHPAAERSPDPDEVLQMEHIAAVTQGKSEQSSSEASQEKAAVKKYLAVEAQVETQDEHLILGLIAEDKTPITGIKLSRAKAHQVLRMLMEQAGKAEWELEQKAAWMQPMKYGKGAG